jgi:DNA-binding winged helix-turn-helix (wHTH) protein
MAKRDLLPETTGIGRVTEIRVILDHVDNHHCCSLVGVSNMGKSVLLRALTQRPLLEAAFGARASRYLVAYVDCNRMLHVSEQGLYELILRCLLESQWEGADVQAARAPMAQAYAEVVEPVSALAMSLAFNRAIAALLDGSTRVLVLVLDEFDEPLRSVDGRVLLNLRALIDQYTKRLVYVTATGRALALARDVHDGGVDEFCELFAPHIVHLQPLAPADAARLVSAQIEDDRREAPERIWPPALPAWLAGQAGGHPGLLIAAVSCAGRLLDEARHPGDDVDRGILVSALDQDATVLSECDKLWDALSPQEQRALEELSRLGAGRFAPGLRSLLLKGLVSADGVGLQLFAPIWRRYVLQQQAARRPAANGVYVDAAKNEAWVDGRPVAYLTPLESRLLAMLYEHRGQTCTKEAIVKAVYGRGYIENDDPALQRLVRRLRERVEPDPSDPIYIVSVRGYGYKLAEPMSE